MEKQQSFADMEYAHRRRKTKRDEFLEKMDGVIPWKEWVSIVEPYYPNGKRGRRPRGIETMLRMLLLENWFDLSDEGIEDAIYDSYAMKWFVGIDFAGGEQVPDATTLCRFRKLLTDHHLQEKFFSQVQELLRAEGREVRGGTIVDATIIEASGSRKNKDKQPDPEMHSVKKGSNWYFGMRVHLGVDPVHGFAHTIISTAANEAESKVAPKLLREDDTVVYGDAGYLGLKSHVKDGVKREYRINQQIGTFKRYHGDSLAWQEEKKIECRKSSMRSKVEYVFHVVKDIFHWRRARYDGIYKNHCQANILFASANLYMLARG